MRTSKMILVAFVLLGAFYCQQVQGGEWNADSTGKKSQKAPVDTAKTKTIKVNLNSAEDLQNLLKMLGGQAKMNGQGATGVKKQNPADSTTTKTIKLNLSNPEDLQNLMKMLGGKPEDLQKLLNAFTGKINSAGAGDTAVKASAVKTGEAKPNWWAKSVLNQKAPKLIVDRWITEEPKTDGKFVIMDHWATMCGPCKLAIPKLNEWSKLFKKDLVIIGLARDDSKDKDFGIEYYRGVDTKTFEPIDLHVLSYVLLVDPKGIVRWEGVCKDLSTEVIKEIIAKYK